MGPEPQLKPPSAMPTRGPAAPLPDPAFIAPVANRKVSRHISTKIITIIVGCFLALVLAVGLIVVSSANDPVDDINKLQAMMQSLTDIVSEGRKSAKSPDVVKITSDAYLLISGDAANLKTVFATIDVKSNKIIADAEKSVSKETLAELKRAAVDARFDSAYVPILLEKLRAAQTQLSKIYDKSSRPTIRAALKTVDDHFTSLITSLEKISV